MDLLTPKGDVERTGEHAFLVIWTRLGLTSFNGELLPPTSMIHLRNSHQHLMEPAFIAIGSTIRSMHGVATIPLQLNGAGHFLELHPVKIIKPPATDRLLKIVRCNCG